MQAIDELNLLLGIGPARVKLPVTLQRSGYTAVRPIGKGGFGQAHLVFHAGLSRYFVVKHVNMSAMSAKQRRDAHNEIDMLQQLDHPNIIRYVEYVEEPPNLYIVMEYADGGDLHSFLKKTAVTRRCLPEEQIMTLFAQIALALKHMHDRRMLHRDIKTQNVFMTKANEAKLGDFGISTVLNSTMAMAQTMCGTPCYFSPELCQGKPYNNKSDIWALGVLLFEMCCAGELPFEAANIRKLMGCICNDEPRPIPQSYSTDLRQLLMQMLSKDPKQRPDINGVLRSAALRKYCPAALGIVEREVACGPAAKTAPSATAPPPPSPLQPPPVRQQRHEGPEPTNRSHSAGQSRPSLPDHRVHHRVTDHNAHRDILFAEPPSPAVEVIQPHVHCNDTNAEAYHPALLLAAREAAASVALARDGTVDDWGALSDEQRDRALGGAPQQVGAAQRYSASASVVEDEVPVVSSVSQQGRFFLRTADSPADECESTYANATGDDEGRGEGCPVGSGVYFRDPFCTTLDTEALTSAHSSLQASATDPDAQTGRPCITSDMRSRGAAEYCVRESPTVHEDDADTCIGGNCLCGATVYAAWLSMAIGVFTCDCMACKRFSGAERVEWIHFPGVSFRDLLQHSPAAKTFVVVPRAVEMHFCGECGSTIAMTHADIDGCVVARATLSDNSARILAAATRQQQSGSLRGSASASAT